MSDDPASIRNNRERGKLRPHENRMQVLVECYCRMENQENTYCCKTEKLFLSFCAAINQLSPI